MVSYDEVKSSLNELKRNVLKYLYAETISRRYNVFNSMRTKLSTAFTDINTLLQAKAQETALGYLLEQYYQNPANQIGKKAVEFQYADNTISMTGLDGNTYDNPEFPQIQLTSSEIDELLNSVKNVPAELRKGLCILRVKAEDTSSMPREPDEEDSLYAYYLAEVIGTIQHHDVDYAEVFGEDIIFKAYVYQSLDPMFGSATDIKLVKVEAESLVMRWFYNGSVNDHDVIIAVDVKPTIYYADPDNPENVRRTTAMFVMNVYNRLNVNGQIIIQGMEIPLKAQKHYLVLIGSELTGLRGYSVLIEHSWT